MSFTMVGTNWGTLLAEGTIPAAMPFGSQLPPVQRNPMPWRKNGYPQCLYASDPEKRKKTEKEEKQQKQEKRERYLLCKRCEHRITKPDYRIGFQGVNYHTFLNPSGKVFHIGCFSKAEGCMVLGEASSEWTWFQGFQWQVALCRECLTHLGWFYASESESAFFGLILDTLV